VNDPVKVIRPQQHHYFEGVIAYLGPVKFGDRRNDWVGVRLTGDSVGQGKNDGSVQGERYFRCNLNSGVFVRKNKLLRRGPLTRLEAIRLRREIAEAKVNEAVVGALEANSAQNQQPQILDATERELMRDQVSQLLSKVTDLHQSNLDLVSAKRMLRSVSLSPSGKKKEMKKDIIVFDPPVRLSEDKRDENNVSEMSSTKQKDDSFEKFETQRQESENNDDTIEREQVVEFFLTEVEKKKESSDTASVAESQTKESEMTIISDDEEGHAAAVDDDEFESMQRQDTTSDGDDDDDENDYTTSPRGTYPVDFCTHDNSDENSKDDSENRSPPKSEKEEYKTSKEEDESVDFCTHDNSDENPKDDSENRFSPKSEEEENKTSKEEDESVDFCTHDNSDENSKDDFENRFSPPKSEEEKYKTSKEEDESVDVCTHDNSDENPKDDSENRFSPPKSEEEEHKTSAEDESGSTHDLTDNEEEYQQILMIEDDDEPDCNTNSCETVLEQQLSQESIFDGSVLNNDELSSEDLKLRVRELESQVLGLQSKLEDAELKHKEVVELYADLEAEKEAQMNQHELALAKLGEQFRRDGETTRRREIGNMKVLNERLAAEKIEIERKLKARRRFGFTPTKKGGGGSLAESSSSSSSSSDKPKRRWRRPWKKKKEEIG